MASDSVLKKKRIHDWCRCCRQIERPIRWTFQTQDALQFTVKKNNNNNKIKQVEIRCTYKLKMQASCRAESCLKDTTLRAQVKPSLFIDFKGHWQSKIPKCWTEHPKKKKKRIWNLRLYWRCAVSQATSGVEADQAALSSSQVFPPNV